MQNIFNYKKSYLLSLLVGSTYPLIFSPFQYHIITILIFGYLLFCYTQISKRKSFIHGWWFGIGAFTCGISWIYISIHEYGNVHSIIAILLSGILISYLALYPAIHGLLYKSCYNQHHPVINIIIFAILWTLLEWIRGWMFTGFPWLYLGYSQVNSILTGYLPIIGVFGTTCITIVCVGLITEIISSYRNIGKIYLSLILLIIILTIAGIFKNYKWTTKQPEKIKVALAQANIAQQNKWDLEYLQSTLNSYQELTYNVAADLIVWPEAAIPLFQHQVMPFIDQLNTHASQQRIGLIIGIPIKNKQQYYNAAIGIGSAKGEYHKKYLVPFGEFIPFSSLLKPIISELSIPMGEFSAATHIQQNLKYKEYNLGILICYEVAFATALYNNQPADILITISNDAWFGNSIALPQHFEIVQARAKQMGKYHITATNTGITGIVDHNGTVINTLPIFTKAILTGVIHPMVGKTPWAMIGPWIIILLLSIILLICLRINK